MAGLGAGDESDSDNRSDDSDDGGMGGMQVYHMLVLVMTATVIIETMTVTMVGWGGCRYF